MHGKHNPTKLCHKNFFVNYPKKRLIYLGRGPSLMYRQRAAICGPNEKSVLVLNCVRRVGRDGALPPPILFAAGATMGRESRKYEERMGGRGAKEGGRGRPRERKGGGGEREA